MIRKINLTSFTLGGVKGVAKAGKNTCEASIVKERIYCREETCGSELKQ